MEFRRENRGARRDVTTAHRARTNQSRSHTGSKTSQPSPQCKFSLVAGVDGLEGLARPPVFSFLFLFFFDHLPYRVIMLLQTILLASMSGELLDASWVCKYEALMPPGWDLFFRLCWFLFLSLCLLEEPCILQNVGTVESRWSCIQTCQTLSLSHFHPYLSRRIRWGRWPM